MIKKRCSSCGLQFEDMNTPDEHGNLVGNPLDGFKRIACTGIFIDVIE